MGWLTCQWRGKCSEIEQFIHDQTHGSGHTVHQHAFTTKEDHLDAVGENVMWSQEWNECLIFYSNRKIKSSLSVTLPGGTPVLSFGGYNPCCPYILVLIWMCYAYTWLLFWELYEGQLKSAEVFLRTFSESDKDTFFLLMKIHCKKFLWCADCWSSAFSLFSSQFPFEDKPAKYQLLDVASAVVQRPASVPVIAGLEFLL